MRIIAGQARGRRLKVPAGHCTRPTPDRVREAVFSWLAAIVYLPETQVLDLFAGSGALGLEALSRGAAAATFVESEQRALLCLRANAACMPDAAIEILPMTAARALAQLAAQERRFGLVFLDPPFAAGLLEPTLATLCAHQLLSEHGVVVCEHASRLPAPAAPESCRLVETRRFGDVAISLFNNNNNNNNNNNAHHQETQVEVSP